MTTDLDRFLACMEYGPGDRRPNHELGAWPQTQRRWRGEAGEAVEGFTWRWFDGEAALGLDRREFVPVDYGLIPPFAHELLDESDRYEVFRDTKGRVHKALKDGAEGGARMCMDTYVDFPVHDRREFRQIRRRLVADLPQRLPGDLDDRAERCRRRRCPWVLGRNCAANGFYWRARELMGTENLSYAWYDQPALMHEMMDFLADFFIEVSRPVLQRVRVDYFTFNEDMAMKTGPLLGPRTFAEFIFPRLRRVVEFLHAAGVAYVAVDTDGDPTALVPLLMDAGVAAIWPLERAAGVSPLEWRKRFGRSLRLWGGVDKRVLPRGRDAVKAHLAELIPLIEEGGFIPTVDHTVPPDVSWDAFREYMELKRCLLAGEFARLR